MSLPKYVSDIFLTIFTAVLLDCLKQTYQFFKTAIFQDVSEDLIISYNLISLFLSSWNFFTALYMGQTIIIGFVGNLKIS